MICAVLALLVLPTGAAAEPALPSGFQDEVVFDELEMPTNFRFAKDGRVFVAERSGRILVYENLEDDSPTLFADLRASVYDNGDRGLLGLELDPKFTEGRPYLYALYTWDHVLGKEWDPATPEYGLPGVTGDPGCPGQNGSATCLVSGRLVRLTEDPNPLNPDKAIHEGTYPKEEELLQGWCQQFSSHSVGELQFGPEGALYVSGGDGADYESIPDYGQLGTPPNPCGDPPTPAGVSPEVEPGVPLPDAKGGALRSQNLDLLSGAILRIDPDTGKALPGNPLAGADDENARRSIAKGFRNPFRFTFDPQTGEIYTGNVGFTQIEEIDRFQALPASLYNSGWPCFEGIERQWQYRFLGLDVCETMYAEEPHSASLPFFAFSHGQSVVPGDECPTESGSAIGGIAFYEGKQFPPAYKGALFFADPVRGCVWAMLEGDDGKPDPNTTFRFMREGKIYPAVKMVEGPGGYLYYSTLYGEGGSGMGAIHRIAYRPGSPTARLEAKPRYGLYDSGKFETTLDASSSSDPSGDVLTYEWDLDEDGDFEMAGGEKTQTVAYTEAEQEQREEEWRSPNRVITVRVKDGAGLSSVARVTVYPGDQPPTVEITSPGPHFRWGVGDEISLWAEAEDSKGGELAPMHYYWETRLAHCPDPANPASCHVHPLQTFAGIRGPHLVAPQHDYPSYIEVVLRVSDYRGLSGVTSMKLDPRTVDLNLASDPPGVQLRAGGTEAIAPFTTPAIDGSQILISAPPTTALGGRNYTFAGWSDGGGPAHPITVHAGQTDYTASYTASEEEDPPPPRPPLPPSSEPESPAPPRESVPQTKLGRRPAARSATKSAAFTFSAGVPGATFRCKLDRRKAVPCRSPKRYGNLKPGRHTFRVWATAGVITDPTPAKFSWRVLAPKQR